MTIELSNEQAVNELKAMQEHVEPYMSVVGLTAYNMAIKTLEQQQNIHDTCKNCVEFSEFEQQPCEDCISRAYIEPIIEELENICVNGDEYILDLLADIKNAPSVTSMQTRWIPVSERLPEEFICDDGYVEPSDYVLVWGDHGNYGVSRYWGNRRTKISNPNSFKDWMDLDWVVQKPIAWMPLPEPYKAESEGAE